MRNRVQHSCFQFLQRKWGWKFILVAGILVFIIFAGCKKGYVYLGECMSQEPSETSIEIKFSHDFENYRIPLRIFEGTLDNGVVIFRDTITVETYHITLPVNRYYSAVAEYHSGAKMIKVVDATKVDVVSSTQEDGSTCYQVKGDKLNLKLAY